MLVAYSVDFEAMLFAAPNVDFSQPLMLLQDKYEKKLTPIDYFKKSGTCFEMISRNQFYVPQTTEDRAFFRKLFTGGLFVVYPL